MKKIFSLFAAMMLMVGSMSATTIYCKMDKAWWKADGAAVAVHHWGGETAATTWPGVRMTPVEGDADVWSYDVPADVTGLIFVRVNGSGDIADWGAKTADLALQTDGKNLYTITSEDPVWGDPGVAGEWSVYGEEPVSCDWASIEFLGGPAEYANQFKVCKADGEHPGVVNIQQPGWATEVGIYMTFPSAAFGEISLPATAYDVDGAGIIFHLSAFTQEYTEVSVVVDNNPIVFTVYNAAAAPQPVQPDYYLAGTMTDWAVAFDDAHKFAVNPHAEGEYKLSFTFAVGDMFKVVKVEGEAQTWLPEDYEGAYVIDAAHAGLMDVYFRPDGQGAQDWHYGYIYVAVPEVPIVDEWAEIKFAEAAAADDIAEDASYTVPGTEFALTLHDSGNKMVIDGNDCRFGTAEAYTMYNFRLKSGGASGSDKNYFTLNIPEAGTLRIAPRTGSNSATDRALIVIQGGETLYNQIVQESQAVDATENEQPVKVYPYVDVTVAAGEVVVRYTAGMNFYAFAFKADGGVTPVEPETIPTTAPAVPAQAEDDVMAIFCNHYPNNNANFGISGWAGAYQILDLNGINVGYWTSMTWECIIDPAHTDDPHDFSAYKNIHVDLWAPLPAKIKFTAEAVAGGNYKDGQVVEMQQGWNSVDFVVAEWAGNYDFKNLKCFVFEQYQTLEGVSFEGNPFAFANLYFYGKEEQGVENVNDVVKAVKMIENGQVIIIKNGVKYNVMGARVR